MGKVLKVWLREKNAIPPCSHHINFIHSLHPSSDLLYSPPILVLESPCTDAYRFVSLSIQILIDVSRLPNVGASITIRIDLHHGKSAISGPGRQWRDEELLPGFHLLLPRQRRPDGRPAPSFSAALGLPVEPGDGGGGD